MKKSVKYIYDLNANFQLDLNYLCDYMELNKGGCIYYVVVTYTNGGGSIFLPLSGGGEAFFCIVQGEGKAFFLH